MHSCSSTRRPRSALAGPRRAGSLQTRSGGETLPADAVVFNGDVAALRAGLLGDGALTQAVTGRAPQRSLSAITWSIEGAENVSERGDGGGSGRRGRAVLAMREE